jgi:hypothetical protein
MYNVPYQVVVDGLFVLDVSLNDDGTVERIDALRNPRAMPGDAKTSISGWKFRPASSLPRLLRPNLVLTPA